LLLCPCAGEVDERCNKEADRIEKEGPGNRKITTAAAAASASVSSFVDAINRDG
jgi:hypothetical protein